MAAVISSPGVVSARNRRQRVRPVLPALRGTTRSRQGSGYLASTVNAQVTGSTSADGLADGTRSRDLVSGSARRRGPDALDRGDSRQLNNIFNVFHIPPTDDIVIAAAVTW
jgi:hypothetical protein